jgi:hypothetical protein
MSAQRNRSWYGAAVLISIGCGLASRWFPRLLPVALGKYPGDAFWALMVFFAWAVVLPKKTTLGIAAFAYITCCAVELLKLCQAPWLVAIRHSTVGHLVFGHAFTWQNFIAYAAGVAIGMLLEYLAAGVARLGLR